MPALRRVAETENVGENRTVSVIELTEEQRKLQQAAIAFARESLTSDMIARDRESHFDREAWRRCADFGVLGVELCEVGDQVFDHRQVRQRVDADVALDFFGPADAGQGVDAVNVHGAGAADAFAAGAAEGQAGVDLGLDLDQGVKHHRAAVVHIQPIGVDARVGAVVGVPAVDAKSPQVGTLGFGPGFTSRDAGIFRQGEFDHFRLSIEGSKHEFSGGSIAQIAKQLHLLVEVVGAYVFYVLTCPPETPSV